MTPPTTLGWVEWVFHSRILQESEYEEGVTEGHCGSCRKTPSNQ